MKKKLIIIGKILLVVIVITGVFGYILEERYNDSQDETIHWMQDISGIEIPSNSSLIEFYAGMEYGKLLKYKLTDESIDSLITRYGLSKIHKEEAGTLFINDIEKNWEEKKTKGKKDYYFLEDCIQGLRWALLIEKNQSIFWFEVIHADFSGDGPECEKHNNSL